MSSVDRWLMSFCCWCISFSSFCLANCMSLSRSLFFLWISFSFSSSPCLSHFLHSTCSLVVCASRIYTYTILPLTHTVRPFSCVCVYVCVTMCYVLSSFCILCLHSVTSDWFFFFFLVLFFILSSSFCFLLRMQSLTRLSPSS